MQFEGIYELTFLSNFSLALFITYSSIPAIIRLAEQKNLYDTPDNVLKKHQGKIPTLGGIAIFGATLIAFTLFASFQENPSFSYAISALLLLFFTGAKDDIIPLTPYKKVLSQFLASLIFVFLAGIRLTSFHGFLYIYQLPYIISIAFSILTFLVIINSFNLLDGINGLAGGIGLVVSICFAVLFFIGKNQLMLSASISLSGALLGFLYFNFRKKAYIFMGDTGSLVMGAFFSIFAIEFIESNQSFQDWFKPNYAPLLAFTILIIPLFDTLRVIILRLIYRKSLFQGDRRHLHHFLLDIQLTHLQASGILFITNIFLVIIALAFRNYPELGLITIMLIATLLSFWLYRIRLKVKNGRNTSKNTTIEYAQE